MKQILLVEDHSVVRLATRFLIHNLIDSASIMEATNFEETLTHVSSSHFDLIMLDIDIPGGEGFNMIPRLRKLQPKVSILVFSGMDEALYAMHYLKAGANGFLAKNSPQHTVKAAILAVLENGRFVSDIVQQQLMRHTFEADINSGNPLENLSQRELEVMDLLLDGKWTKEIATRLNITGSSVSTYKSRIFEKLEVSTIIEMFVKVEHYKNRRPGK
ncbi:response regulator transcription factor [Dyadobacter chenwenxiniae]|uniref:Response regulator transcription factor n=1 Tax=Dyadobacter chenwenxiniae TaxID=2906456 RepID=A0A9X1PFH0_9BACT|nr:response regulator transcription factor [Dyadobacter chenwenxiniae]MCF0060182.1 response regulator transcription factor [Dyadobacter chenwenxiniae]UON85919.1 response regulator transcription factor [Dyadobacter chenwenxiniae]